MARLCFRSLFIVVDCIVYIAHFILFRSVVRIKPLRFNHTMARVMARFFEKSNCSCGHTDRSDHGELGWLVMRTSKYVAPHEELLASYGAGVSGIWKGQYRLISYSLISKLPNYHHAIMQVRSQVPQSK